MSGLDIFALVIIFFLIVAFAAVIVILGSLPGKIAVKRGHPAPDAVNVASWIGIATGIFWPIAFIWAFLPIPRSAQQATEEASSTEKEIAVLRQRIESLEATTDKPGDVA